MKTVYLCGGINGLSDVDAKNWRDEATSQLSGQFNILDPMRRDYRGKELAHVQEIISGDLDDINASDILLVNAVRPSWGTAMELFYAFREGKTVVAFCGYDRLSPWLAGHTTYRFADLQTALTCITVI